MSARWKIILFTMILVVCTVWLAVHTVIPNKLKIIVCDVGQGDGILVVYKSTQILIDGGPDKNILNCLGKHVAFWDRELEVVVLTHPQADHFTGLIEVFKSYRVKNFLANNIENSTPEYRVLVDEVAGGGTTVLTPDNDVGIRVGLIYLDIVSPTKEFINQNTIKNNSTDVGVGQKTAGVFGKYTTNLDTNEFSIVAVLGFRNFKALFTGDMSPEKSDEVAQILENMGIGSINYIKVPHHGSKNGLTDELIKVTRPKIAVISAGKNNSYGHPHQEILKMLNDSGIKILRTDLMGEVVVETDGEKMWYKVKH